MPESAPNQIDQTTPDSGDGRTKDGKPIDVKKVFHLKINKGLSNSEISSVLGYSPQYVGKVIKSFAKLMDNPDIINAYDSNRVTLLNNIELNLLRNLVSKDKIKKASLNNIAYAVQNVSNLRRLESGQTTANLGVGLEVRLAKALEKSQGESVSSNETEKTEP